jgi:hypothetical protein
LRKRVVRIIVVRREWKRVFPIHLVPRKEIMDMRKLTALSFTLATVVTSSVAAQDPVIVDDGAASAGAASDAYVSRGITLPQRTLRVDLGPYEQGINNSGFINGPQGSQYGLHFGQQRQHAGAFDAEDGIVTMGFGLSYGILDQLEVGVNLLPLPVDSRLGQWTDGDSGFGNITLYGRYAFLNAETVQIGAQLAMSLPTGTDHFGLGLGLPVNFNLGNLRLETGVEFEMFFGEGDDILTLDIPLGVTVGLGENAFVGGHVAFTLANLDDMFLIIPIGAHGGYSFRGGAVDADITGTFSYSIFSDNDNDSDTRYAEWTIGVGGTIFIPL